MDLIILQRHLKKIDEDFNELLFYSKYSTIYILKNEKWENLEIYGTFVLYSKSNKIKIIRIFNKCKLEDITIEICQQTRFRLQKDILKVINDNETYGIWFHNMDILKEIFTICKRLNF